MHHVGAYFQKDLLLSITQRKIYLLKTRIALTQFLNRVNIHIALHRICSHKQISLRVFMQSFSVRPSSWAFNDQRENTFRPYIAGQESFKIPHKRGIWFDHREKHQYRLDEIWNYACGLHIGKGLYIFRFVLQHFGCEMALFTLHVKVCGNIHSW